MLASTDLPVAVLISRADFIAQAAPRRGKTLRE